MTGRFPQKIVRFSLALVLLSGTAACGNNTASQTTEETIMKYFSYVSELGVDLSEYLQDGEGEITETPYAYLRFRVSGDVEALQSVLTEAFGTPLELTEDEIPGYKGHEVAKKLTSETLVSAWNRFLPGQNGAKTRSIEFYLTQDETGTYFFYCFG